MGSVLREHREKSNKSWNWSAEQSFLSSKQEAEEWGKGDLIKGRKPPVTKATRRPPKACGSLGLGRGKGWDEEVL